jgi:hypothetical protein
MTVTTTEQAVFQSVEAALFFSYLIESVPVLQQSPTSIVLHRLLKMAGSDVGADVFRPINFDGLTHLEVRAQCAMVRAAVEHHLPVPEADAVKARYGWLGQPCKAEGIAGVRNYCLPMLSIKGEEPTIAMAWGVFGEKRQREFLSVRLIADEFGLAKSSVGRDMQRLRTTERALLNRAIERLKPMFEQQGVVESAEQTDN